MRAAIYNPYLDTLGGGERYTLSFAKILVSKGYQVDLEWKDGEISKLLQERFDLNLNGINIIPDIKRGDGYDLCFWVSDGSIPMLRARRNLLHFQVPFHNVGGRSLLNRMKLFRINKIICNSIFTKKIIDEEFGVDSLVIYPPIDTVGIKPRRKENIILSVGRFSSLLQSKHQDTLVKVFKKLFDKGIKDWNFILVGGSEVGDAGFSDSLARLAYGYPIEIIRSPGFKFIKDLYGRSRLFWSASGYGEDENANPERVEHFGITVVEAMAGGSVPVVFKAGGHKEIIQNGENGFFWEKESQLLQVTEQLINDKSLSRQISRSAVKSSKNYDYEKFEFNVSKIL